MNGTPFLFDKNMFDNENIADLKEEEAKPKPEFTVDDLEIERKKAYETGKKAGFKESLSEIEQTTLTLLKKIDNDMSVLFASEDDRNTEYENEAVNLTLAIVKKLLPLYIEKHGEDELKAVIKNTITDNNIPEKIKIELHSDIITTIEKYIKTLEGTIDKKIMLTLNNSLKQNECNILWPNGGIIYNQAKISQKIIDTMKEALAERGVSVHDREDDASDNTSEKDNITEG